MNAKWNVLVATVAAFASMQGCVAYNDIAEDGMDLEPTDEVSDGQAGDELEGEGQDEDWGDNEENIGTSKQFLTLSRADRVSTLTVADGYWGTWRQTTYCGAGTWAVGYNIRFEGYQGSSDDTGLNSVELRCVSKNGAITDQVTSFDGFWGSWMVADYCSNANLSNRTNFIRMARLNVEPPRGGSTDDTAADDVEFRCIDNEILSVPGASQWGDWSNFAECPNGTAVCGLSIRYEDKQGGGDDTAMNGLKIECCAFDGPFCGNGICEAGENAQNCLIDCDWCGNNYCGPKESQASCMHDCDVCGNGYCGPNETLNSCPMDCDTVCGNGYCGPYEDSCICPEDCGWNYLPTCYNAAE